MQADDSMMPVKGRGHVTSPVSLPPLPVAAVTLTKGLPGIPCPALTAAALQVGRQDPHPSPQRQGGRCWPVAEAAAQRRLAGGTRSGQP